MVERRRPEGIRRISADHYFLERGFVYFSAKPVVVSTVLGSCVAVTLWDSRLRAGAMCHFLHAAARNPAQATPVYGNAATKALLSLMDDAGSNRKDLEAQIIGGASLQGQENSKGIEAARRMLSRRGVRVVSEDTGGRMGRKVVFDLYSGEVAVLKVHKLRDSDWQLPQ